jgi:alpha-galactosidase
VLGIGGDIGRWSDDERAEAGVLVDDYRRIRPIVQLGTQHWLVPPAPLGTSAVQYVSDGQDAVVLFLYQIRGVLGAGGARIRLRGLDPTRTYRRRTDGVETSGAALMAGGVAVHLIGDWRSELQEWTAR